MQLKVNLLLPGSHCLICCSRVLSCQLHPSREMLFVFEATESWKSAKKVTLSQGGPTVHKDLIIKFSALKSCAQMTGEGRQHYEKTMLLCQAVTSLSSFTSLSNVSFVK